MRVIAFLALCVTAIAAVPASPERITGGSGTSISNYPSIASLQTDRRTFGVFRHHCGSIVINNRSILTAAHCIRNESHLRWRARVGSTSAHSGGQVLEFTRFLIHPNFNYNTMNHDIAMMRCRSTISFNNNVRPASIAGSNYNLRDNQAVWAAGWGSLRPNQLTSETLNHVQILSVNQALCRERYAPSRIVITNTMLCSGYLGIGGRDQCNGDSGGPLYHNGVLVGVCSFGVGCGSSVYPGVNTRVSSYTSWIQNNA